MNLNSSPGAWIVIRVRPHYELVTSQLLRYKGYEIFLPTYRSKRQWSDRTKELELPLFPGYTFCKLTVEKSHPIIATPGVMSILGTRKEFARVDDLEIEALQNVAKNRIPARPCVYLNAGDRVRIQGGSLAGVEGILVRHKSGDRLVLSIDLVQRSIEVEIDGARIEVLNTGLSVAIQPVLQGNSNVPRVTRAYERTAVA
jgi:transcription antitermination factor NusG